MTGHRAPSSPVPVPAARRTAADPAMGSMGTDGGRYAIVESEEAGVAAIGTDRRTLPALGEFKDLKLAQAIRPFKGKEASEQARRVAREQDNAARAARGEPMRPAADVREAYLTDVTARAQKGVIASEAPAHVGQAVREVEGKAAAPGVRFTGAGFVDPTGQAAYDAEQKAAIQALIGSGAAREEMRAVRGCGS